MTISIKSVDNPREREAFIQLPYKLNAGNKLWIPPLLISQEEVFSVSHPFWKKNQNKFYLAYRAGEVVGRIVAFINGDHSRYFKVNDGFFGFLEAVDDEQVFQLLFQQAEGFLRSHRCQRLIGPINPTIHHELGVLTDGFEHPPYVMLTYNQKYYDKHIQACGYKGLKDFSAYNLNTADFQLTDKMLRIQSLIQKRHHITIRTPRLNDFNNELKILHEIYNNAFIGHWGFAPISVEDFRLLGKDLKMILDKEMVLIAEINNKPVGFLLAVPNLNEVLAKIKNGRLLPLGFLKLILLKKKIKSIRVITVAIRKEYQHLGIGSILYPEIAQRARERGYKTSELSWVVDDNVQMNKICREVGAKAWKNYRLYDKAG